MWDKLAVLPFAFQSLICPSRTSDTLLLALLAWIFGLCCGSVITALALSPGLRRCLARAIASALHEPGIGFPPAERLIRADRLSRYRQ